MTAPLPRPSKDPRPDANAPDASFGILGPLEVHVDGEPIEVGGPKQRAVLAMLVIEANRVVPVDRIVDQLWGDAPPASAVGSLHAYVSNLRRALEPGRRPGEPPRFLVTKPSGYALMIASDQLDAWRFERATEAARDALGAGAPGEARDGLDQALSIWRGAALAEFAWEPFARPEAARLEDVRWTAREMLVEAHLAAGDARRAVAEAEALLDADPLRERLWKLLMLGLYRAGRQADSLHAYRRAREILLDQLGVDPNPELREMERLVLEQSSALDWTPPPERAATSPSGRAAGRAPSIPSDVDAFVGREEQLRILRDAVVDVADGRARVLLIVGEPGIGKTRLAREAARSASDAGHTVVWGSCHADDAAPAFWPWTQIVRQLARDGDPAGDAGTHLADLFPVTEEARSNQHAPFSQMLARTRLYDGVTEMIVERAREGPLTIILDDLQWADVPSIQLLELLAERAPSVPLLLIGVYRDGEIGDRHPLVAMIDALVRTGAAYLPLAGLPENDLSEMIERTTRHVPQASAVTAIRQRTGGNPFFVVELLRLMTSEGVAGDSHGMAARVPFGVSSVVRRRLARLPDFAIPILTVAAVHGRMFDFDVIASVRELDRDALLNVIEAGVADSLLEEDHDVAGRFRFAHDLVRESLLERLSAPRRARIHALLAEALVEMGPDRDPARAQQLASHFWFGSSVLGADRALPYVIAGADDALARFAYEEEAEHLQRAVALLDRIVAPDDQAAMEFSVQTRLGTALARLEGWASRGAGEAFERSVELAASLEPEMRLTSLWGYALFLNVRADFARAREVAEQLLEQGRASADPVWLSVAHETVGIVAWHTGRSRDAIAHFGRAIEYGDTVPPERFSTGLQNPRVASRCHLAATYLELGRLEDAERRVAEALSIAGDDPYSRAFASLFDAWVALYTGDRDRARRGGEEVVSLASSRGLRLWEALGSVMHGWGAGDPDEVREAIQGVASTGARMLGTVFNALLADAALVAGRAGEAADAIARAFAAKDETGERGFATLLRAIRDRVDAAAARPVPARARRSPRAPA